MLAQAMVGAVSRARDNELFVIMADLSELGHDLTPIVKSCRVARARHHHVLVIVPWPADVPSPDDPDAETPASVSEEETGEKKAWDLPKRPPRTAKGKAPGTRKESQAEQPCDRGAKEPHQPVSRVVPIAAARTGTSGGDGHALQRRRSGADRTRPARPGSRAQESSMSSRDDDNDATPEPLPTDRADGSTPLDMRETFDVLFSDVSVRNFTFAGLGALGMMFLILLQQASDYGGVLIVVIGSCGILLRWSAAPYFVLLILTWFLIFPFGDPTVYFRNELEIIEGHVSDHGPDACLVSARLPCLSVSLTRSRVAGHSLRWAASPQGRNAGATTTGTGFTGRVWDTLRRPVSPSHSPVSCSGGSSIPWKLFRPKICPSG